MQLAAAEGFDRRLLRSSPRPVAVAFSGGGDSLALLLIAAAWARDAGRRLLVLTVDHRLRPESAVWTEACAATADRLGLPYRSLAWTGDKPATGLPAAARIARHILLADAARDAGARVILMGHTADDLLEAGLMRAAGSTTPDPREWAPSPVWPQGRGVFLLRPLLSARRGEIRDWLAASGEHWIDDPTNEDTTYARPRARQAVAGGARPSSAKGAASAQDLALACRADEEGGLEIARSALTSGDTEARAKFISAACLCAAGTDRPPSRDKTNRLLGRLTDGAPFVATLAGARIEAEPGRVRFRREPGEAARGGLASLRLVAGETGVWDGRFEIVADQAAEIWAEPGASLPSATGDCARITPLAYGRLLAACGAIDREPF